MSNFTNSTPCNFVEIHQNAIQDLFFAVYYVLAPIHFVFGTFCHSISLIAFYKLCKNDGGYAYQFSLTFSEFLEVITFAIFVVIFWWCAGIGSPGFPWYKRTYALMWVSAHIAIPLVNTFISTSFFLNVAMAVDRVYFMWKPASYNQTLPKRKSRIIITVAVCFLIGLLTSVFEAGRFNVLHGNDGEYKLVANIEYLTSDLATALAIVHTVVLAAALISLLGCNMAIIRLYFIRVKKVEHTFSNSLEWHQNQKAIEKALVILTVSQSALTSVSTIALFTFFMVAYAMVGFSDCESQLFGILLDGTLMLNSLVDFFLMLTVSGQFRDVIKKTIKNLF